jgi:hypothetical protein
MVEACIAPDLVSIFGRRGVKAPLLKKEMDNSIKVFTQFLNGTNIVMQNKLIRQT